MYSYVPQGLPQGAPLVVALHGCTQTANDYYTHSGWSQFADQWGFAVVFPQTSSTNNSLSCFSWFDSTKDTRGKGEAASVAQMVSYAESHYGSDSHRVYVTGLSAGAGMTADLLADYPDVFAGGAIDSGLPAQCATTQTAASSCQTSNQNFTPAQWGDKVRNSDPGYTGPWPRVAIWQGSADYTVYPVNATELRDQWTNVWGISQTASSTQNAERRHDGIGLQRQQREARGRDVLDQRDGTRSGRGSGFRDRAVRLDRRVLPELHLLDVLHGDVLGPELRGTADLDAVHHTDHADHASDHDPVIARQHADTHPSSSSSSSAPAQCFTASNYAQTVAGRAYQSGGYTYADGSNQNMGLWNVLVTHTLKETSAGYYVIADSGCYAFPPRRSEIRRRHGLFSGINSYRLKAQIHPTLSDLDRPRLGAFHATKTPTAHPDPRGGGLDRGRAHDHLADRRPGASADAGLRDVLVVGNSQAGTVSVIDGHTFANLGSINVIPDLSQRMLEIYLNPIWLAGYEAVRAVEGGDRYVDDATVSPDGKHALRLARQPRRRRRLRPDHARRAVAHPARRLPRRPRRAVPRRHPLRRVRDHRTGGAGHRHRDRRRRGHVPHRHLPPPERLLAPTASTSTTPASASPRCRRRWSGPRARSS